jgi:hypothetical protein
MLNYFYKMLKIYSNASFVHYKINIMITLFNLVKLVHKIVFNVHLI